MSRDNELIRAVHGIEMPAGSTDVKSTPGRVWAMSVMPAAADVVLELHNAAGGGGAAKFTLKAIANGTSQSMPFPQGCYCDTAISFTVTGAGGKGYVVYD